MEVVDFQHYAQTFSSPRPARRQRNSVSNNSLSNLFGEGLLDLECDDYEMLDDMVASSDSDSDEVIDIEAIDELGSIMSLPDKKSTFSSARTAPLTTTAATAAPRRKSAPSVTADGTSGDGLISSPIKTTQRQDVSTPVLPRTRHDSEQIVNDLVALEGAVSTCAKHSPNKLIALPENGELSASAPALEQIQVEEMLANQRLNKDDFSLLGIEGIEAEDLESLFEQFEGVTEASPEKASVVKLLSPVRVTKPKPRPRPLTLEDYRRLRGVKPPTIKPTASAVITKLNATVEKPKPMPTLPIKSVPTSLLKPLTFSKTGVPHKTIGGTAKPQQLSVTIPVTQGGAKTAVLSIPPAPWVTTAGAQAKQKSATAVILQTILDDHDYCVRGEELHVEKASNKPTTTMTMRSNNHVSSSNKASHQQQRDIKAELTMLLEKLPEYIAAVSGSTDHTSSHTNVENSSHSLVSPSSNMSGEVVREEIVNTGAAQISPSNSIAYHKSSLQLQQSQCNDCENTAAAETGKQISEVSSVSRVESETNKGLPRAYAKPFPLSSRGRGRSRKRKYRKRHRAPSPVSSSSCTSSSSDDSCGDDASCDRRSCDRRSCDRRDSFSANDDSSSSLYESYSSDESMTRCSSSNKRHKYRMSRKSRRKATPSSNRRSRKSSPSQSGRGRHKVRPEAKRRRRHKSGRSSQSVSPYSSSSSSRSPSLAVSRDASAERRREAAQQAHQVAMSERRVVYVGGISEKYSKADLRKRFGGFGEIESVATFLRESSENYGFVTFYSKADAYAAIEKGNDVYGPKFNLGFGGRRMFCDTDYADLDGCQAVKEEWAPSVRARKNEDDDFDALLRRSMKKIKS